MHELTVAPGTDPTLLYRGRDELYAEDMLIAAVKGFDFFTVLAGVEAQVGSIDEIARHFGFHPRPVDVMTTHFVARGLLERDGERLRLTATAREHLVASSPWFLGPYFPKLSDRPIALDLIEVLRTDRPANYASRKHEVDWHKAMETEAFAEEFTAAMDCRGRLCAQALARHIDLGNRRRLLDIAGGSGIYACSLAARFPELTASVLEKPPVDRIAQRAIDKRGYGARVGVVAGDMLAEPLPEGYDVHLWSNVLHDWDVPIVRQLLQASAAALDDRRRNRDPRRVPERRQDRTAADRRLSVLLMHVTQGRCFSVREMATWLHEAGFSEPHEVQSAIGRSALVAHRR